MPITDDGNWICTSTGRQVFPLNPKAEDISIEDVSHALSHQCRYTGHTFSFYSVAEHSIWVARGVAALGGNITEQRWGLIHDASEAYLSDISSPVKRHPSFAFYREVEKGLMRAIAEHFGLPAQEPEVVRYVDAQMIAFESMDKRIIKNRHPGWPLVPQDERLRAAIDLQCLLPASAHGEFMVHYKELFG